MGVDEVCGSVDRVDYEGWGGGEAAGCGGFFAQEAGGRRLSRGGGCVMRQFERQLYLEGEYEDTYE